MERLRNRLAELRQRLGHTQQALAARAGISRQSLSSLESGRAVPSTTLAMKLARLLGSRVEDLFWLDEAAPALVAELAQSEDPPAPGDAPQKAPRVGDRVALVSVNGRWVAHGLSPELPASALVSADGIIVSSRGKGGSSRPRQARISLLRDPSDREGTFLCVGCAPALGILSARAEGHLPGQRVLWLEQSSTGALEMLRDGHAHVAGAHLFDEDTEEFNLPFVARLWPDRSMLVVELARWEAGLVVPPGNPRKIREVADLGEGAIRVVSRDPGAGAERLLRRRLTHAGIPLTRVRRTGPRARGHLDVARAVSLGLADAGVAIKSAALALGLDFVPLVEERFDLILPRALLHDPRAVRLLDTLTSRPFRRELESLGGHSARGAGTLMAPGT